MPGLTWPNVNKFTLITEAEGTFLVVKVSSEPSLGLDADRVRFGLPQPVP
ncbi:hypothetical protein LBMAG49_05850 [Planctomycetota bacterium]|nr:hypothetical protein LBMAG49_05850 [Planctomycetota bacterium]